MGCAYAIVSRLVGAMLLAAAGLKLAGSDVVPFSRAGWVPDTFAMSALVLFEAVLGIWLVWGANQTGAWFVTLLTFLAFAGVSGRASWVGSASCGCVGDLDVPPVYVLLFDVMVVAALLVWPPRDTEAPLFARVRKDLFVVGRWGLGIVGVMGLMVLGAIAYYGTLDEAVAGILGRQVTLAPHVVRLGAVKPNAAVVARLEVTNRGSAPLRLVGGTSDCTCVATHRLPVTVAPGQSTSVDITVQIPGVGGEFTRQAWLLTDQAGLSHLPFRITAAVEDGP